MLPLSMRIRSAIESYATGDALGMVPEFMTRNEIENQFGIVDRLLDPSQSRRHSNLKQGQITDDTEQLLYCLKEYRQHGISLRTTSDALINWFNRCDPVAKGFIGRSSQKAIESLLRGADPETSGLTGTTCGGAMRAAAAALHSKNVDELPKDIYACVAPTHNTNLAMEGAFAFGYAVFAALHGGAVEETIKYAIKGGTLGRQQGKSHFAGASSVKRIALLKSFTACNPSSKELMDYIYDVIGTGMETTEVVPAVFGIFMFNYDNPWAAIKMGASLGGDTDTIAAMVGMLTTLAAGEHNIPKAVLQAVLEINSLDFSGIGL
ncbi:MAG: ADP-ribosylglycohydrolase family protein [Spirochaetota bacterium]